MVTPQDIPAGAVGLSIQSRLNGQLMQNANTRDMLFPVAETIALLTECLTADRYCCGPQRYQCRCFFPAGARMARSGVPASRTGAPCAQRRSKS